MHETTTRSPVVAGVDESEHRASVIEWAVAEARQRNRPLQLVYAFDWAMLGLSFTAPPFGAVQEELHAQAARVRDETLTIARTLGPDLDITAVVADGGPARVLTAASENAALVVVGHRGRGGFPGLLIGSVAAQVAAHAHAPVVVVRPIHGQGPAAGRVVVGVDGSPSSALVLDFAFAEAAARGTGLTAVHAWTWPTPLGPGDMQPLVYDVDEVGGGEARLLSEVLAGWGDKYADVDVQQVLTHGRPAPALVSASAGAELLVVGARGRGGFIGLRIGSVSRAVLHHAPCPVAIVHPTMPPRDER